MEKWEIGKSLKNWRNIHNLTQSELARKTSVDQRNISYWEKTNCSPNIWDLIKLADYYDISLDELIGRDFGK